MMAQKTRLMRMLMQFIRELEDYKQEQHEILSHTSGAGRTA